MKDAELPKVTPLCSFQASGGYPPTSGSGQGGYSGNPPPVMMPGGYPVRISFCFFPLFEE